MLAAQLTLLLALLVWAVAFIQWGSLRLGCLAVLFSAVCLGRDFLQINLGPLPLSIDRLFLALLLVAYFVQRSFGKTTPKRLLVADYLLLSLIIWLAISTFTHDFTRQFGRTAPSTWRLLAGYLMPFVVYWIARQVDWNREHIATLQRSLVCFGIYLAVTGMFEVTKQWGLVFPRYIADPTMGIHFGRARGPMLTSINYGVYLGVCLLAAWFYFQERSLVHQIGRISLVCMFLVGIYLSYTRSVWLGVMLAGFVVSAMTLQGRVRALAVGFGVAVVLVVWSVKGAQIVSLEREYSGQASARSAESRASFAYISMKMFQDKPLCGFGFGQFPIEKLRYLTDRNTDLNLEHTRTFVSHNTVLTLLVEVGIVGLGLFVTLVMAWGRMAIELWLRPDLPSWVRRHAVWFVAALGIWSCQLLLHEVTYKPEVNMLIFLLAGLTVSLRAQAPRQPATHTASAYLDRNAGSIGHRVVTLRSH